MFLDHLEDGLLDLRAVLEGGGEGAHGRAGDEGAHDATVVLQLQADHLKEKMTDVKDFMVIWKVARTLVIVIQASRIAGICTGRRSRL